MKESKSNHFRILVVDDDVTLLKLYESILTSNSTAHPIPSLEVTCCTQGDQAIEAVEYAIQEKAPYAVVFLDLNMPPGPDGRWTAAKINELDPNINIVMVTGYRSTDNGLQEHRPAFSNNLLYLQKPFHKKEIIQFATALSTKWQAEKELQALHANLELLVEKRNIELIESNLLLKIEIENGKRMQEELQQSFESLKKVMDATIQAIAMMVEKRDPYTSGHMQRVSSLTRAIGEEIGLTEQQIEGAYMAAAIHDIGKISLPAEILTKPIPLSDIERSLIQAHSQAGYDILVGIEFPWPLAEIVLQHHERMDGSGYPQGLSGDSILEAARIIGVADVVETMSSHRPYRPSLGIDKAIEEITKNRGVLYDPPAVDACLKLINDKKFRFPG
jgi:HD-GYP domain-containing protein (c-di-GMP phosphodiesterase class II)